MPTAKPAGTPTATLTQTRAPTSTPRPTRTPKPTATQPGGGSGRFIFELPREAFQEFFPDLKARKVIFTADIDGGRLAPLLDAAPSSWQTLQGVSPDGKEVLFTTFSASGVRGALWVLHRDQPGSAPFRLAVGVDDGQSAVFLDSTRIAYLSVSGMYVVNSDGTNRQRIGAYIPSLLTGHLQFIEWADDRRVYWWRIEGFEFRDNYGQWYARGDGHSLWWTALDGSGSGRVASNGQPFMNANYAFSPDHKRIAWIPGQVEPDCSYLSLYTKWVRDGTYAKEAANPKPSVYDESLSARGQAIDMAWADAYARRCFILYVASLSDMDHPVRIPLIPAPRRLQYDYIFGRNYQLMWMPDSSRLLVFNNGTDNYLIGAGQEAALYSVDITAAQPSLAEWNPRFFATKSGRSLQMLGLSPDGHQVLFRADSGALLTRDLVTGAYSQSFALAISPRSVSVPVSTILWLP